ncbi:response regulator receiver domain-containing protein [Aneurinibacillus soli]|uniref:Transcriptional regulatory protein SrrA n=1 Tax=Aneurinibacillus soli TaxID=1500254 RepID=A0A0U5AZU8_9BACL|nr:response regulator [Aneurinibacillus soli]PYE57253.1 response regulator receiver domain-containing protein [Aneurinibacillus soli]BAU29249.1 Transcriptional regulatory protein SrrA [Aneurinibacillus soli]
MNTKILIADDEDVLRMLITETLEIEDYELDEAQDGLEAYEKIMKHEYDLILLDLMMPGKTGLEVCQLVRAAGKTTPIVMLTAKTQAEDRENAVKAGVNYFFAKPFSPMQLLGFIQEILEENPL